MALALIQRGRVEIGLLGCPQLTLDQAAGSLIVEEAVARVTDRHGIPLDFAAARLLARNEGVIASNGPIHGRVVDAIRQIPNRAQSECERAAARPHPETESPWAGTKPST